MNKTLKSQRKTPLKTTSKDYSELVYVAWQYLGVVIGMLIIILEVLSGNTIAGHYIK